MAEMNEIVKLAVDLKNGKVEGYSNEKANDVLRAALIEANGGSTVLDYRAIRDQKCQGLFAIIEEIIAATINEGLDDNDFFNTLVDYRNVALGDKNEFIVENGNDLFVVAEAADGTQGIRRQRIENNKKIEVPTTLKVVRIYEELNRILAGRVDFGKMIDKVGRSFQQKILEDVFNLWTNVTATNIGGSTYYPGYGAAGSYSEDTLMDLVSHVEAAAGGKQATIIATKKAAKKLATGLASGIQTLESGGGIAGNDIYNDGFVGKWYGTPVVGIPQRHLTGTNTFAFPDDIITVIAGDQKPIKCVREGDPLIIMGDPLRNADLTQEYFCAQKYGVGLVVAANNGIGLYNFT